MTLRLFATVVCMSLFPLCSPALQKGAPALPLKGEPASQVPGGALDRPFARLGAPEFDVPRGASVVLSPDGGQAAVSAEGQSILIWDVNRAKVLREIGIGSEVWAYAKAWSADGRHIAAVIRDGELGVWHAATGTALWPGTSRKLEDRFPLVRSVRFIDGDRSLAVVWTPPKAKAWYVEIWDVASGKRTARYSFDKDKRARLAEMPAGYDIRHVALSPSGERAAWLAAPAADAKAGGSIVWVFETATDKLLHTLKDVPRSHRIGLPDDGRTLVLCPMRPEKVDRLSTGQSTVVNVADGRVKFRCTYRFRPATWGGDGAGQSPLIDRVQQAAFRLDGSLLTVDDVGITRWDIDSGKLLEDYNEPTLAFSVSANEKRIAVRCW